MLRGKGVLDADTLGSAETWLEESPFARVTVVGGAVRWTALVGMVETVLEESPFAGRLLQTSRLHGLWPLLCGLHRPVRRCSRVRLRRRGCLLQASS